MLLHVIIYLAVNAVLALIPAFVAKNKGYTFFGFYLLSFLLSFSVGLMVALFNPNKLKKVQADVAEANEMPPAEPQQISGNEPKRPFLQNGAGILVMALIFVFVLIVGSATRGFYSLINMRNVLVQAAQIAAIAFGVVITARAKGPDFSMASIAGLAGIIAAKCIILTESAGIGVMIALTVCVVIGAVNGSLILLLKLPSVAVTIGMGIIIGFINRMLVVNKTIFLGENVPDLILRNEYGVPVGAIVFLLITFAAAFFYIKFSQSRVPIREMNAAQKTDRRHALAYVVSSVLAGLAGIYLMFWIKAANGVSFDGGLIMFVFGAVMSSRLVDNRRMPVIYALITAVVYTLLRNVTVLNNVATFYQSTLLWLLSVIFFVVTIFANRDAVKRMAQLK